MRTVIILASLLVVGACGFAPPYAMVDGATVVGTEKTLSDHAVSLMTGKNCKSVRTHKGLPYCEEDELVPPQDIYCYRTLAKVTCYDRPDPHAGRHRKVGDNEHNMMKKTR